MASMPPCSRTALAMALAVSTQMTPAFADDTGPRLGLSPIDEVIQAMTLEEKVALVLGQGMSGSTGDRQGPVVGVDVNNRVPGAAGTTFPIERLGIPSIVLADGPAGVRISSTRDDAPGQTFHATAFPIASLLASSWDTTLVERVGQAMGSEAAAYGIDIFLTPALNLHRYPLGGRNFEYYSEDPLISGKMAAAMARGIQHHEVGTSPKHYAANNHEWNRNTINVKVSERALRELYLKGFEITVKEGDPWTIMSSYNLINGTYTSESPWLLTEVLRNQWGFEGTVMTDWYGGKDAVEQMKAGNELLMPGTQAQQRALLQAVQNGQLDVSVLDRNIERILDLIMRTRTFRNEPVTNEPDLETNALISREAATEGMVLLKNEQNALPLPANGKLALFGNSAYDIVIGGTGSGDVYEAYSIPMPKGLQDAGYTTDRSLEQAYTAHIEAETARRPATSIYLAPDPLPELEPTPGQIEAAVAANDAAVITLGRNSGEFVDREAKDDFYLTEAEQTMLKHVSSAFRKAGKPVIAVLNIGGIIDVASWRDQVDAILLAWQPGQEAGNAIADVLSGKVNPSGKLTDTFAIKLEDYPAAENFPGVTLQGPDPNASGEIVTSDREAEIEYRDDIWVGYRHFNTRDVDVAYPFGHGLSYTRFEYRDLQLLREDAGLTASVTITNTGHKAGKEVVQMYVSAPQNALEKPDAELRAFAKTRLLQPGQSQKVVLRVDPRGLTSFDPDIGQWVAAPGRYTVSVGASSRDIRQQSHFDKGSWLHFAP
ncbi:MAG: glycoside hydrolase family 3 C-terminal domain-containing protein [Lautropia sp.]|nr:glycoside hydrolase family 3 C-terminal domain-containing protein [Lautropia sp.]